MRARKLAAVALDQADEPPPQDELTEVFVEQADDPEPIDRVCLACGGDGTLHDGCAHDEIARLPAPSRTVHDALQRLRRAAAEHRAAARALRVQVLSEVARDRGELETRPAPRPEPCPRCLIRDAGEAAQAKQIRPKGKGGGAQQALPFKTSA